MTCRVWRMLAPASVSVRISTQYAEVAALWIISGAGTRANPGWMRRVAGLAGSRSFGNSGRVSGTLKSGASRMVVHSVGIEARPTRTGFADAAC